MISIRVPVRIESEANKRGSWHAGAARAKSTRQAVTAAFIDAKHEVVAGLPSPSLPVKSGPRLFVRLKSPPALPVVVFLARIAPRELDDDNLARACKAARDQVAELLGVDDRDKRVTWRYEQRRGAAGEYALEIAIAPRGERGEP